MLPAGSTPIYYVDDLLGTSRVVSSNTGVTCYDADFYPYGGERAYTSTCSQNYKFEGKERDSETGNDDFGARYYSNRFGRWLSSDWSSVPAPVPYANLINPQTLNLYAMVADDPESFADLDGHTSTQEYQLANSGGGIWGDAVGGSDFWVNDDTGDVAVTLDSNPPPATPQAQSQTQNQIQNQNQDQNQNQNQAQNQNQNQQQKQESAKIPAPVGPDGKPLPPPIPPPGAPGTEWQWNPDQGNPRGGTWGPKGWKGPRPPAGSWDDEHGHWDVDDGNKVRTRYLPDGTKVDHNNNPIPRTKTVWERIQNYLERNIDKWWRVIS